jgi:FKBP-type peptidyl-prolyl cis-trans isomerase
MANSNSQRVAAFMLALMFLLTTIGAAGYVIYELNSEEAGLVSLDTADTASQSQEEEVQDNSLVGTIISDFSGSVDVPELRFDTLTEGTGEEAQPSATVTIHYTGALASNGTIFDSSVGRGEPATFPLDNLIVGWQEGIPGMKVGEKRRLFIPSDKGYGESGSGASIPPSSDLIFDIELIAVVNQ